MEDLHNDCENFDIEYVNDMFLSSFSKFIYKYSNDHLDQESDKSSQSSMLRSIQNYISSKFRTNDIELGNI